MKRIELPTGIQMEVEAIGPGDRPFVLVRGYTGSRDEWREQLPRLAAWGRTLAITLVGHDNEGEQ